MQLLVVPLRAACSATRSCFALGGILVGPDCSFNRFRHTVHCQDQLLCCIKTPLSWTVDSGWLSYFKAASPSSAMLCMCEGSLVC